MKKRVELLRASWTGLLGIAVALLGAIPALADETPGPAIPEPGSYLVFLAGALGVAWAVRRRRT
jgi:PEP-CTERM motif-containing protein